MIFIATITLTILLLLQHRVIVGADTALIEYCPSPWKPYVGTHQSKNCHDKCMGHAFHTNEGQLVCFNHRDLAEVKSNHIISDRKLEMIFCKCGYFTMGFRKSWIPCDLPILEMTKQICKEHCARVTVYAYVRRRRKLIVFCETETRNEFYEVSGHLQEITNGRPGYTHSKQNICVCGVSQMVLKRMPLVQNKSKSAEIAFEECTFPWEPVNLHQYQTASSCGIVCKRICNKGEGFLHEGKAFCFSKKSVPAKRRTTYLGGDLGRCDCGYTKFIAESLRNNSKASQFIPCDPPIFQSHLNAFLCKEFCSKTTVYLYRKGHKPLTIRCIFQPDGEILKHRPLIEKCDKKIYEKKSNSKKYTKCRCGLGIPLKRKILTNLAENADMKQLIPASWPVKKKRTARNYSKKFYENDDILKFD